MSTRATHALLRFARRWFDERTVANVFEPLLADHQREWLDAAPSARLRIAMRTSLTFLVAMLTVAPRALLFTPTPPAITRRIIARLIIFTSVGSGLMTLPFLTQLWEVPPARLAWLLVLLLPSAIVLVFPFAMGFAVDGARRQSTPSPAERMATIRAALAAVLFMIVLHGWVMPEMNQQFRATVQSERWQTPARGAREMTTSQLFAAPSPSRPIRREQHSRATMAVLPLVLIWMRWRALNRPSPQWLLPAWLAATVTLVMYFGIRSAEPFLERSWNLSPGVGAWIPLAVFVIIGLTRDVAARGLRRSVA